MKKSKAIINELINSGVNMVSIIPNSHFYSDLDQLKLTFEYLKKGFENIDHVLIGIQNTIDHGYRLVPPEPVLAVGDTVLYKPKKGHPLIGLVEKVGKNKKTFLIKVGRKQYIVKNRHLLQKI